MRNRPFLFLFLLAAALYLPGLDRHGVTNWQEGQRLIVAREMQYRLHGEEGLQALLLPTVHGHPYLAKPPLLYWLTIAVAEARRGTVDLWDLRLVVALAGIAGVAATYWAGLGLFERRRPPGRCIDSASSSSPLPRRAAWWSAIFLMTGLLPTRSARIGEIDILLIPTTAIAVGALARAWRSHLEHRRTDFRMILLAAMASTWAAFAKGPPALTVIALAAYGGIALWHLGFTPPPRGRGQGGGQPARGEGAAAIETPPRSRPLELFFAYSRTHPVGILLFAALIFYLWWRTATHSLAPDLAAALAADEAEDNLRLLVPGAILKYLEAASYAVGLGSLAAIAACIWLVRDRPRIQPGWCIILAWSVGPLLLFSLTTKGVPRYLTPAWPGFALLGGLWFASLLDSLRGDYARRAAQIAAAAAAAIGITLTAWYGYFRDTGDSRARSPRDLVAELRSPHADPDWELLLYSFEFQTPALDYYQCWQTSPKFVGSARVQPIGDTRVRPTMMGGNSLRYESMRLHFGRWIGSSPPMAERFVILIRATQPKDLDPRPAIDRLREAGLDIELLPTTSRFLIDSGRTEVKAVRVNGLLPRTTIPQNAPGGAGVPPVEPTPPQR